MKKRVLALILAAVMCASLCAGCGSSKSEDSSGKTAAEAESEAESEASETAESTDSAEEIDLTQLLADAVADHDEQFPDNPIKDALYMDCGEDEIEEQYPGLKDIAKKQMVFAQSYITGAPPEFMLIEVENADDVEAVKAIMQARVDERSQDDPDYQDNADAWKNNAQITSSGNYVFLAVMFDGDEIPESMVLK